MVFTSGNSNNIRLSRSTVLYFEMSCNIVKYRTVRKFPIVPRLAAGGVIRKFFWKDTEGLRASSSQKVVVD